MATQPGQHHKNNQLIVSVFDNVDKTRAAQKELDVWDKAQKDIKLGASVIIYKDADGKIKYDHSGSFDWRKGALIGLLVAPLTGGAMKPVFGSISGLLHTWVKDVKREEVDQIAAQLKQNKSVLAVLCDDYEKAPVSNELTQLGGTTVMGYQVPTETVERAHDAVSEAADNGEITPETK